MRLRARYSFVLGSFSLLIIWLIVHIKNYGVIRRSERRTSFSSLGLTSAYQMQDEKLAVQVLRDLDLLDKLTESRIDELLSVTDPKDKNGVALSLLETVSGLEAVVGGKVLASQKRSAILVDAQSDVLKIFHKLQFPVDCRSARKVNCNVFKNCGVGCQIHHLAYCFSIRFVAIF